MPHGNDNHKTMKKLYKEIRQNGYQLKRAGKHNNHVRVIDPKTGNVVCKMSSSPPRTYDIIKIRKDLENAGVLAVRAGK